MGLAVAVLGRYVRGHCGPLRQEVRGGAAGVPGHACAAHDAGQPDTRRAPRQLAWHRVYHADCMLLVRGSRPPPVRIHGVGFVRACRLASSFMHGHVYERARCGCGRGLRSTGIYLFAVWTPAYQLKQMDPPLESSFSINAGMMFVLFFIMLLCGYLSDKVGLVRMMKAAAALGALLSIPAFLLIGAGTPLYVALWRRQHAMTRRCGVCLHRGTADVVGLPPWPRQVHNPRPTHHGCGTRRHGRAAGCVDGAGVSA